MKRLLIMALVLLLAGSAFGLSIPMKDMLGFWKPKAAAAPATGDKMLMETGDYLLLESGDKILFE